MATAPDPRRMRTLRIALLISLIVALPMLVFAWRSTAAPQPQVQSPHGAFKEACADCHDANGWKPARVSVRFDHGKYGFPLTGAHATGNCLSCHRTLEFKQPNTLCANCHTDPHRGEMGTDCAHCHGSRSFVDRGPMLRAHQLTRFPLTGGHASVDCEGCHKPAAQGQMQFVNTSLQCSGCHMPQYQGAKSPDHVAGGFPTDCVTCHGQLAWNTAKFNHDNTAFPLTGQHRSTTCVQCHTSGKFAKLATDCASCHQHTYDTASPSHVSAGFPAAACASCHNTSHWSGASFDHQATAFPLTGAHTQATCNSCHSDGVYKGKSTACMSCHTDKYNTATPAHGPAGFTPQNCASCHTTTQWSGVVFDHNRMTSFALTGAHTQAACNDCHADQVFAGKSTACLSCHQANFNSATPTHTASTFPPAICATCHNTTAWSGASFNHNTQTTFALTGAHVPAACTDCHGDGVYQGKSSACLSCHNSSWVAAVPDHPAAQFAPTECASCHTTSAWTGGQYNHTTRTTFPLTGAHVQAACVSCHGDKVFQAKSTACMNCHMDKYNTATPPHPAAGFAAASCANCHSTTQWAGVVFNHNTMTSFPLTGAHVARACADCHSDGVYVGKSTACVSCHQSTYDTATPPHLASGFPAAICATCHNTTQWAGATFDHNTLTTFPLTGAHATRACADCHGDGVYVGKSTACLSCHNSAWTSATPSHTAAQFDASKCATCHNTTAWAPGSYNHTTNTTFPLTGAHVQAACTSCHGDNVFKGKSTACMDCHMDKYNTATPSHAAAHFPAANCATCHTTTQWAGATFAHDSSWFPIYSGTHLGRWSACSDCHQVATDFSSFTCLSCHPHDDKTTTDGHHSQVRNYSYDSAACYRCHPTGRN
jgi:hypothetical protein